MLAAALIALVFTAEIAVHVDEAGEVEKGDTLHIAEVLARALETRTASIARVEDQSWWGCPEDSEDRCVGDVRSRTGSTDVVILRLFGGARSVRVIADRYSERRTPISATIDLSRAFSRTSTEWSTTISGLAASLFPEAIAHARLFVAAPPVVEESGGSGVWPYVLIGAGVASGLASTGLWISSRNASDQLESDYRSHTEYEALTGRMHTHGLASGGFLIGAGVAVLTGLVLLWSGESSVDVPAERVDPRSSAGAL